MILKLNYLAIWLAVSFIHDDLHTAWFGCLATSISSATTQLVKKRHAWLHTNINPKIANRVFTCIVSYIEYPLFELFLYIIR